MKFLLTSTLQCCLMVALIAGTGEAGGVDLKNIPPFGASIPINETIDLENASMKAAGKAPSGNWVPIRVDEDGYVLTTPVQQMDSQGRIKPSPCYQRMREAMRSIDSYVQASKNIFDRPRVLKGHQEQWDSTMEACVK